MNTKYARLENGNLVYAPKILTTPHGVVMNPGRMTYLENGWKFLDLQPPADPPEGKEYALSGYNETPTDIQAVYKLIDIVVPLAPASAGGCRFPMGRDARQAAGMRTFSKLKLVIALANLNAPKMSA